MYTCRYENTTLHIHGNIVEGINTEEWMKSNRDTWLRG